LDRVPSAATGSSHSLPDGKRQHPGASAGQRADTGIAAEADPDRADWMLG